MSIFDRYDDSDSDFSDDSADPATPNHVDEILLLDRADAPPFGFEEDSFLAPAKPKGSKPILEIVRILLQKQRRDGSWTDDACEEAFQALDFPLPLPADFCVVRSVVSATQKVLFLFTTAPAICNNAALVAMVAPAIDNARAFLASSASA